MGDLDKAEEELLQQAANLAWWVGAGTASVLLALLGGLFLLVRM